MLEIRLSAEIAAPAGDVWSVVGNFNGLSDWHPWVMASILEPAPGGVGRRLATAGGTAGHRELTERLVSYNASRRECAYTIFAGPAPFTDYTGHFLVAPNGPQRCVLEFHARFRAAPGRTEVEATERIRTFYEAGFENLLALFGAGPGDRPNSWPDHPRPVLLRAAETIGQDRSSGARAAGPGRGPLAGGDPSIPM